MIIVSVLYGLAFAFGIGASDVLAAVLTRRLGVFRTVLLLQLIGLAGMSVFALAFGLLDGLPRSFWLLMFGITLLVSLFYLGFFEALRRGPIALVGPIVAAHSVIVVLLAVLFLGETLAPPQIAAMLAVVVGVALASVNWRALKSGESLMTLGAALAVAVCVAAGFWQFAIAALSREHGWFAPVFLTRLYMAPLLIPLVAVRREWIWRGLTLKLAALALAVAALENLSLLAFTRGSQVGDVAIVAAASTAYPVVPVIGGMAFFGERLSAVQIAGLVIVAVGLTALSLIG